jgi:hypothetical protein
MIVAAIAGRTSSTTFESDLFVYNGETWVRVNPSPYAQTLGFPLSVWSLKVNPPAGNDYYLGLAGSVLRVDNDDQTSPLATNRWNWISFNSVDPFDSLKHLFAGCDSLQEIRDQYGNMFRPNDNPPLDEIGRWEWLKGYGVKSYVTDTMEVCGPQIPADTTLTLLPAPQDSSWIYNFVSYLPNDTLTASDAFLADSDYVIIVKNDDGDFWRPIDAGSGFDLVPGEGYQVGVSDTFDYQYPVSMGQNSVQPGGPKQVIPGQGVISSLEPEHFQFTKYTGDFYPIYIANLLVNGNLPEAGDEVAVYTPAGLCVGACVNEGTFPLKIAAWKDDPTTEAIDGYTSGQILSFKFWDASTEIEVPLEMSITVQGMEAVRYISGGEPVPLNGYAEFGKGFYAEHSLTGTYILPSVYNLAQNYPNPFNPTTIIHYDLPYESKVKLEVFNVQGRLVMTLVDGKQSAGFLAVYWSGVNTQGAEIASGVYFYRLKADATLSNLGKKGHYEKVNKMVLLK